MVTIKVGDLLKASGLINEKQLKVALIQQKVTGDLLGDSLIKRGFISAKEFGQTLAGQAGIEFIDLSQSVISEEALRMVPKDVAEKTGFIPIDIENGVLSIGITNPSNIMAIDTVVRMTRNQPKVYMVDTDGFCDFIEKAYFFLENPIQERLDDIVSQIKKTETSTGATVTSLTDLIIMDGIRRNATDIHVRRGVAA